MDKARLFLAVTVGETLKQALSNTVHTLSGRLPGVRWVKPQAMHITVKFFGTTALEAVSRIDLAMRSVVAGCRPFVLVAGRLGVFPNTRRPAVIWADITQGAKPLTELAHSVLNAVEQAGFEPEKRAFVPHITLGRIKKGHQLSRPSLETVLNEAGKRTFCSSTAERITLFASELTPEGARYSDVMSWKLGDGAQSIP